MTIAAAPTSDNAARVVTRAAFRGSECVPDAPLHLARVGGTGWNAERRKTNVGTTARAVDEVRHVEAFEEDLEAAPLAERYPLGQANVDRVGRIELQHIHRVRRQGARCAEVVDDPQLFRCIAAANRHRQAWRPIA